MKSVSTTVVFYAPTAVLRTIMRFVSIFTLNLGLRDRRDPLLNIRIFCNLSAENILDSPKCRHKTFNLLA